MYQFLPRISIQVAVVSITFASCVINSSVDQKIQRPGGLILLSSAARPPLHECRTRHSCPPVARRGHEESIMPSSPARVRKQRGRASKKFETPPCVDVVGRRSEHLSMLSKSSGLPFHASSTVGVGKKILVYHRII